MHCFVESLATREKIKECISCSTILGTILARKLPQEIKDKIPWEKLREKWTVNYVIELVNQALFALEALGEHLNKPATPKPDQKKGAVPKPQFRNSKPTTTLYTTGNNTANSSYPSSVTCRFCKEEHWPSECPSVYTLSDRKQFCIDNHWCENCFSRDHQGSQCNTVVYCRTCKEQHHIIFCPARISKLSGNKVNKPHNNNRAKRPPNTKTGAETDVNTLQVVSSSEKTIALPLADLSIRGVKGYLPVRTIFDSGTQKCLIAKPVVKALGLVPCDSIFIAINGINQRGSPQKRDVVHLNIKTSDGLIKISAIVVDHLSTVVRLPGLVKTTALRLVFDCSSNNPSLKSFNTTALRLVFDCSSNNPSLKSFYTTALRLVFDCSSNNLSLKSFNTTALCLVFDCSSNNLSLKSLNTTALHLVFDCSSNNLSLKSLNTTALHLVFDCSSNN